MDLPSIEARSRPPIFLFLGSDFVKVLVGEKETPFLIHKDLLCSQSEYFKCAFTGPFKEGEEGYTCAPDVSETTFRIFLQWLYGQTARAALANVSPTETILSKLNRARVINPDSQEAQDAVRNPYVRRGSLRNATAPNGSSAALLFCDPNHGCGEDGKFTDEYRAIFDCYDRLVSCFLDLFIFADTYSTRQLRNDVISAWFLCDLSSDAFPGLTNVPRAYEKLPESSTFWQYLLKMNARYWHPDYDEEIDVKQYDTLPKSFLLDVMLLSLRRQHSGAPGWKDKLAEEVRDRCNFHEHTTNKERNDCKALEATDEAFVRSLLKTCMVAIE